MQIGIRLHDGEGLPLEELLPIISQRGFTCAHLAMTKSIREYSTDISALTPGLAMYLRGLFSKNNIDIAVLGCYDNLANPDPVQLRAIKERYAANIRFASLLGCGVVGTETGAPNTEYKPSAECRSREALECFIENLREVVSYAEKAGVIVAIEPVYKHIVYSPQRAREVLDAIGSPNLQIIFDPVNLLSAENLSDRERVLDDAMRLLGKAIAVVHIKDYVVKNGGLSAVAAGEGEMDYTGIMRFIKREKPYIQVTLENTVPENAVAAREYIQSVWNEVRI